VNLSLHLLFSGWLTELESEFEMRLFNEKKKGIILCVEKEIIINREKNIYFREKNNLFSDKYFH
jgi:hypothetical protein